MEDGWCQLLSTNGRVPGKEIRTEGKRLTVS